MWTLQFEKYTFHTPPSSQFSVARVCHATTTMTTTTPDVLTTPAPTPVPIMPPSPACPVTVTDVSLGKFKGFGDTGGDECMPGSEPIPTESCACKAAAERLGKVFRGDVALPNYTPGCSERINHSKFTGVWFNTILTTSYEGTGMNGKTAPV